MNREIEFRGFDSREWRYGDLEYNRKDDVARIHTYKDDGSYNKQYLVDPYTVGQFTGLLDKHGKRVFEGDILRVKEFKNLLLDESFDDDNRFELFTLEEIKGEKRIEYISSIIWEEGGFLISSDGNHFDMWLCALFGDMKRSEPVFDFEVIGNIYDNPELLQNNPKQ